jgi:hypothetical protein
MPEITLFELGPTRSARARWAHRQAAGAFVGYAVNWGQEQGLLDEFPNLLSYQARLLTRPHCTLTAHT